MHCAIYCIRNSLTIRTYFPTLTQRELATYNTWIYKIILTCPHISNHNTFFPFPNLKQHFGCSTSSSRAFETNSSLIIFPSVNVFLMYPLGGSDVHATFYSTRVKFLLSKVTRLSKRDGSRTMVRKAYHLHRPLVFEFFPYTNWTDHVHFSKWYVIRTIFCAGKRRDFFVQNIKGIQQVDRT